MVSIEELFKGRHFDREIIVLCVPWYLRFKLSFRDLVEMTAERGVGLAHTTIMRWVKRYAPKFVKRWDRFACKAGRSWRVDETYVKIRGRWTYLHRAVDSAGKTVDFLLRAKRDVAAAEIFSAESSRARAACLAPSRSMAIKLLIVRPGRRSVNIGEAGEQSCDRRNT
jgi:transposase-like protein